MKQRIKNMHRRANLYYQSFSSGCSVCLKNLIFWPAGWLRGLMARDTDIVVNAHMGAIFMTEYYCRSAGGRLGLATGGSGVGAEAITLEVYQCLGPGARCPASHAAVASGGGALMPAEVLKKPVMRSLLAGMAWSAPPPPQRLLPRCHVVLGPISAHCKLRMKWSSSSGSAAGGNFRDGVSPWSDTCQAFTSFEQWLTAQRCHTASNKFKGSEITAVAAGITVVWWLRWMCIFARYFSTVLPWWSRDVAGNSFISGVNETNFCSSVNLFAVKILYGFWLSMLGFAMNVASLSVSASYWRSWSVCYAGWSVEVSWFPHSSINSQCSSAGAV